jgi:hypothetical protein
MTFRADICYQCVETTPASRLNQEFSFYDAILEAIEEQFQSKTRRRLGRHLLLKYPDRPPNALFHLSGEFIDSAFVYP